jgi:hypothetical protein
LVRRPSLRIDPARRESWLELTASGQAGLQVAHVRALTIGSQKFNDLAVALPDAQPADAERVEDGVLPTSLFKSLYVNNHEGYVVLNPRTKKN